MTDQLHLTSSDGPVNAGFTTFAAKRTHEGRSSPGVAAGPSDHNVAPLGGECAATGRPGTSASTLTSPVGQLALRVEPEGTGPAGQLGSVVVVPPAVPLVIGLDLSLTGTGMSDGDRTWLIRSAGKKDDDLAKRIVRLRKIRAEVVMHCEGVQLVVVEGPSYGTNSGHMHDRSGLWWLVVQALAHRGIAVAEVAPTTLKKYATGKGNGPKGAMVESAARRLPQVETGGDDNRADALWLYAMGLDHLAARHVVPEAHRVALKSVRWPVAAAS